MEPSIKLIDQHGRVNPLETKTHIGRSLGCEIRIDDPKVSRLHALVVVDAQPVTIEDRSTNGTWVGERRIDQPCVLQDGESIRFHSHSFRIFMREETAAVDSSEIRGHESNPIRSSPSGKVQLAGTNPQQASRSNARFAAVIAIN